MMKKDWFELLMVAITALLVGVIVGAIPYGDDIKQLENQIEEAYDKEYVQQIVDDFELVIELQQWYYQENITSHSFGDWLQINHSELYRRIESYF